MVPVNLGGRRLEGAAVHQQANDRHLDDHEVPSEKGPGAQDLGVLEHEVLSCPDLIAISLGDIHRHDGVQEAPIIEAIDIDVSGHEVEKVLVDGSAHGRLCDDPR